MSLLFYTFFMFFNYLFLSVSRRFIFLSIVIVVLLSQNLRAQSIVINELMTSNAGTVLDEDGDTPDWVELYNNSDNPVNLQNWHISDDSLETDKWIFPDIIIQPRAYLLIFASDKDRKEGAFLHTNFKLGAGREWVFLYDAQGQEVDEYQATCIPDGLSYGSMPDGRFPRIHLSSPTPGKSNNTSATISITPGKDTLSFSHNGGFYTTTFTLQLAVRSPQTRIYYTLDGSIPDENATQYTAPITVKSRKGDENDVSDEETTANWIPPRGEVFKGTVVRAVAYIDACPASPVITHTYFVDENMFGKYTFPIVSIATDRSDFFGNKKGIYVVGGNDGNGENFFQSGKEWERAIHLELFDRNGTLAIKQGMGARIHGRGSRQNPQKSLRIYAREEYGQDRLTYKVFPALPIERFKTLILRSTDADFSPTLFKDELIQTLIKDMNVELQATQPSVVFINGEYWGIHNIRERYDKHYFASHYGVDAENIDFLGLSLDGKEIIEGDETHYNAMLTYIQNNDLAQDEHYRYISTQMDVDNYIDYQIAQLFFANFDWPDNNVRFWRPKTPEGKWRWVFFDCDACMIQDTHKYMYIYTTKDVDDKYRRYEQATFLHRNLLKNDSYRTQFLLRFMHHLNTTFEPGRVIKLIDSFKELYAPEVAEHVYRWNYPDSYNTWLESLEEIKLFALRRPLAIMEQLQSLYQLPVHVFPNPSSGTFTVDAGEDAQTPVNVQVYSSQGQLVYKSWFSSALQARQTPVSLPHQPAGLYIIQIQYGNLVLNRKLMIHR